MACSGILYQGVPEGWILLHHNWMKERTLLSLFILVAFPKFEQTKGDQIIWVWLLNMMQTVFSGYCVSQYVGFVFMLHHVKVKHFRNRLNFL